MVECFLECHNFGLWNIECCYTEYCHWSFCEYSIGCSILNWSGYWWYHYGSNQEIPEEIVKVTKLIDIITSALAVFETSASKALNDGRINEREFGMLQGLHFKVLSELTAIDCKMEAETRTQLQNSLLEKMSNLERRLKPKDV